ncbi:MAG: hypothetical protein UHN47_03775 [Lachnospiraceae bacterium]|nr:hypothetical protein [Lachnospiraceae bacterium]
MAYEVDFIGVNETTKDSDAIGIRWKEGEKFKVGVYDGGISKYGEKLKEHIEQYYFDEDNEEKTIDFALCSHSDLDHVSGMKHILENFNVKVLYMNRPWLYVDDVIENAKSYDGRITKESLERRLKENYKYIAELEEIATEKGIEIKEAFQGELIEERFTVLSPTKEFYLELLVESDKTALEEAEQRADNNSFGAKLKAVYEYVMSLLESWSDEKLRDNVTTSAENEMSVVLLGSMDEEDFLLTGDVGLRGLDMAINYSEAISNPIIDKVKFLQIPHHGGRHNVGPSILNRLVGNIVEEGVTINKTAFVSAGKYSDHPLQIVVNAFTRRGVKVYKTDGHIIHHHKNMPDREGWTTIQKIDFKPEVEEW